ncbi:MAG: hypothetical protein KGM16_11195 [Bacteroidota bacterium]|nr:hypothetical protein [Bacteroidota bacterium]
MKNKENSRDIFETKCWQYKIIDDPYQVFAESFCFANISSFRKVIRQVLLFATKSKVFNKEEPAALLAEFKAVISVILAANKINEEKRSGSLKLTLEKFADKRLYARPFSACPEWEYLPKVLSIKEYKNPYKVFQKFFKYQPVEKWREDIGLVLDYALGAYTDSCDLKLLKMYFHLVKLMEAAHIIDVREVTHVDGYLKAGLQETGDVG